MLYTGCHRISGLTERTATFAVPVMLIASAWLGKVVYRAWIQQNVWGLAAAHPQSTDGAAKGNFLPGESGSSGSFGGVFGSPYSVQYKVVSLNDSAAIEATVKGPAAKLAVILTDPKGESEARIVEKDLMIANSHTIEMYMRDPQAGTWVLTLKTVDPENVVWQKDITFSSGHLTLADVKCELTPNNWMGQFNGYQLTGIQVTLQKDGSLPVEFTDASLALDGVECSVTAMRTVSVAQRVNVSIVVFRCPPTKKQMDEYDRQSGFKGLPPLEALFRPGERHLAKGKVFFGKDKGRKSLDFEKEFVVPGNGTQATAAPKRSRNYNPAK